MPVVFFALAGFVFNFFLKKTKIKFSKKYPPYNIWGCVLARKLGCRRRGKPLYS